MMRFLRSLLLAILAVPAFAQGGFDPVASVKLSFDKGAVVVAAPGGSHLKAQFMKVEKTAGPGKIRLGALTPTNAKDELGDPIWHGAVRIPVTGEGLAGTVKLSVTYQPCTEGVGGVCYAPTTRELEVPASAIPDGKVKPKEAPQAAAVVAPTQSQPIEMPVSVSTSKPAAQPVEDGLLWGLLVAFGWGLVSAFSPCVYPMIPITLAIVGAKKGSRFRGLVLSLALVLGMAVTYMTLAVAVAKVGGQFGASAQKPAFLIPVALLFLIFGISLLGAFEIRLPAAWQAKLQNTGARSGLTGAFLMGLILGPISAPCVGPYFGSVLTDISQHGQVGIGAIKAFVFAVGMGVLFIAVGAFSAALPRSGDWLTRLKQIMGLVILGFAAWTLRYIAPSWLNWAMWALVAFLAAPVLGAFESASGLLGGLGKGLGVLALA
ncbi:MAG TPA: cytochrome c biogenesis protein CcdA, partial [Holophagaceae bacterium]|nr:cytochrome c biogenesis protein CcdA [Holophagaceae bacterium]